MTFDLLASESRSDPVGGQIDRVDGLIALATCGFLLESAGHDESCHVRDVAAALDVAADDQTWLCECGAVLC